MRWAWLLLLVACSRPVGWFRADRAPHEADDYDGRFEPLALSVDGPCDGVTARQGDRKSPVIVLVPGIGGDAGEMRESLPLLLAAKPASVFMFRYGPFEERDLLADRLATGISQLARCIPDGAGRMLVLAHSAGGVLSSLAAARVKAPEGATADWLTVLTVASPLAGTNSAFSPREPPPQRPLMMEMGMKITSYPAPAPGVRVVHLRSSAESDGFMRPSRGWLPNDPSVGVPGAPQIDLPVELDHPQALVYAAKRIADGTWREWLAPNPRPLSP
jgi:pimeloyl-ACP methyl ester carboxylesterase